jgi:hypothetical protein
MENRASGWYPDPDTGQRRYFDGENWLDIPDPNVREGSKVESGALPKKKKRRWLTIVLISMGALTAAFLVIIGVAILQIQSGSGNKPPVVGTDFQQIKRNQCFDEKMRSLRAVVEGEAYAIKARLICNSLYP